MIYGTLKKRYKFSSVCALAVGRTGRVLVATHWITVHWRAAAAFATASHMTGQCDPMDPTNSKPQNQSLNSELIWKLLGFHLDLDPRQCPRQATLSLCWSSLFPKSLRGYLEYELGNEFHWNPFRTVHELDSPVPEKLIMSRWDSQATRIATELKEIKEKPQGNQREPIQIRYFKPRRSGPAWVIRNENWLFVCPTN